MVTTLYLFNWKCGGFNDVWAPNKREAYKRVMQERKETGGRVSLPIIQNFALTMIQCVVALIVSIRNKIEMGWLTVHLTIIMTP